MFYAHFVCVIEARPLILFAGDNGTIDGQGSIWWNWFENKTLNYTRPHLVELMNSTGIVISNLTFINSPFWTIHPVYCRYFLSPKAELSFSSLFVRFQKFSFLMNSQVTVQNVTILAPRESPNTDGIDPGACFSTILGIAIL